MRALLVGGAVLAVGIAAFLQLWVVVGVLSAGVAAHAGLWVYLHRVGVPSASAAGAPVPPAPDAPR